MKNDKYVYPVLYTVVILFYIMLYSNMIFSLPLFGDAATHGALFKRIIDSSVMNVKAINYPPLYLIFESILFSIAGESGPHILILAALFILGFSVFLLIREILEKDMPAIIGVIMVLSSPKVIFYSARMYMEILLSAFFVLTVFFLFKFLRKGATIDLILLSFFTGVTASIKQTGLFALFPSIFAFLLAVWRTIFYL